MLGLGYGPTGLGDSGLGDTGPRVGPLLPVFPPAFDGLGVGLDAEVGSGVGSKLTFTVGPLFWLDLLGLGIVLVELVTLVSMVACGAGLFSFPASE